MYNLLNRLPKRSFNTPTLSKGRVIGCGSNVVDIFHKVESLPAGGQKGYFQNPTEPISAKLVGGVTLNHLCWARLLGVPSALLALEGNDENGLLIRHKLNEFNVNTSTIDTSSDYCTSVSHIFLDINGERCIMMAPGSSSNIDKHIVNDIFSKHFENKETTLFSTEISQIPLNAVIEMLNISKRLNIPSIIDIDVPPSVAITDANLGTMHEVYEAISAATVIKPTLEAAIELLDLNMNENEIANIDNATLHDIGRALKSMFTESIFIGITNGKKGGIMVNNDDIIDIFALKNISQIDSTGAGDAFFGGMIAGIYHFGMPQTKKDLEIIGNIASCTGAACVEVLGALPIINSVNNDNSIDRLLQLNENLSELIDTNPIPSPSQQQQPNTDKQLNLSISLNSILSDCEALTELFNKNNLENEIKTITQKIKDYNDIGSIFVTGIGKSGIVAQRMASSISSISYSIEYINGNNWIHGDIGKLKVKNNNLLIVFSSSGKTSELYYTLKHIKSEVKMLDIVGVFCTNKKDESLNKQSDTWIGKYCDNIINLGNNFNELYDYIPSRSIIIQESFINAVIAQLLEGKNINEFNIQFKSNHPGGNIGKLLKQN